MQIIKLLCILLVFGFLSIYGTVRDVLADDKSLDILVGADGAYIYHYRYLNVDEGFNIYRQDSGETESIRLNEQPVRGAQRSDEFHSMLGSNTFEKVREILRQPNVITTFHRLRRDQFMAETLGSVFPEVASAMGFLFIDTDAPINESVTYRLEFLDELDRPTGETLTKTTTLTPFRPDPPVELEATNDRRRVTLSWHYPVDRTDIRNRYSVQFNVYRIHPETGEPERLNDRIIFRNFAEEDYRFTFSVPSLNTEERLFVKALDVTRRESGRSETLSFDVVDRTPPSIIRNVNARVTHDDNIRVTWPVSVDPDVAGYNIYRSKNVTGEIELLNDELIDILATVYIDTTVVGRNSYFYRISAVDESGNESELSNSAMAIVERRTPPPAPLAVRAEYDKQSRNIKINWEVDRVPDNLHTYIVLRRRIDDGERRAYSQVTHDNIRTTNVIDDGQPGDVLIEGITIQYSVLALDKYGVLSDTVFTEVKIPNMTPPEPPRGFRAVNERGVRVLLNWNATMSLDADHYLVYRKRLDDEDFTELRHIPITQRRMRDEDIQTGETYVYAVSAVDTSGNESVLSETDTLIVRSSTAPRKVRNVQARGIDEGIEIFWDKVTSLHTVGYKIYRANIPTGIYEKIHDGIITDTHIIDRDGTGDHWYRVRAVNSSGLESQRAKEVRVRR